MDEELQFFDDLAAYLETLPVLSDLEEPACVKTEDVDSSMLQLLPPKAAETGDADAVPRPAADTVSRSSSSRSVTPRRRQRAKRSRNLARERMQHELKQLRDEHTVLETQLAEIKRQRTLSDSEQLLVASWQRLQRERTNRIRTESENEQLKQELQRHAAFATSFSSTMQQLVNHRSDIVAHVSSSGCNSNSVERLMRRSHAFPRHRCTDPNDAATITRLVAETNAAYARTECVLQATGLRTWRDARDATATHHSHAQMRRRSAETTGDGAFVIELLDARVHACAKDALLDVMWTCWSRQYSDSSCCMFALDAQASSDTLAARLQYTVAVDGASFAIEFLAVLKLFVDDTRDCITCVWRSVSKPTARFPGIVIDETGWETLSTTAATGSTVALSCTQLATKTQTQCAHTDAVLLDPPQPPPSSLAVPLVNLLATSYDADQERVISALEGLLLQDTAASGRAIAIEGSSE